MFYPEGVGIGRLPIIAGCNHAWRENEMHKASIIVTLALTLSWTGSAAYSQTPMQDRRELLPAAKLNLTLEQRHTIKEFIKDMKADATAPDVTAAVGDPVPQGASPRPIPAEVGSKVPQVKTHRFFVTADQIVIVDPKDNKIADIIKLGGD